MSPAMVEGRPDQAERLRELVASIRRDADSAHSGEAAVAPAAPMVVIASGKGGVGKTNLAVNLSVALSQRGEDVVLVDADVGLANADVLCGLSPRHRLDAGRVRRGGLGSITVEAPGGFRLVPGGSGAVDLTDPTATQRGMLAGAIDEVRRDCSVLLVDSSAGAGRCVTELVSAASLAVLVTTPEPTAVADVYGLLKCLTLRHPGSDAVALVVNQACNEAEARAVHARLDAVGRRFLGRSVPLLGWIAQDPRLAQAVRQRVPVVLSASRSPAARSVYRVARQMQHRLQSIS